MDRDSTKVAGQGCLLILNEVKEEDDMDPYCSPMPRLEEHKSSIEDHSMDSDHFFEIDFDEDYPHETARFDDNQPEVTIVTVVNWEVRFMQSRIWLKFFICACYARVISNTHYS